MPTSTICLRILGLTGLIAGAGCTSTTAVNQSASLAPAPVETPSAVASSLPQSMDVASGDRDVAFANDKDKGTVITAVAYAAPAPERGGLAAIQNAAAQASGTDGQDGAQAVAALAAQDTRAGSAEAVAVQQAAPAQAATPSAPAAPAAAPAAAEVAKAKAPGASVLVENRARVAAAIPLPPQLAKKVEALPAPGTLQAQPAVMAALAPSSGKTVGARSPELDTLIDRYAKFYQVPVDLVRRVVKRESTFNPAARNGPYWGLMQIRHDTAKGMGYQGNAQGLLDAETNLTYAVKYLKGAYLTAEGDHDQAVRYYSRGYYYDAKRRGLLEEAGLKGKGITATPTKVAAIQAGSAKAAEMDRGGRLFVQGLPGVGRSSGSSLVMQAPSEARIGTLAIAE